VVKEKEYLSAMMFDFAGIIQEQVQRYLEVEGSKESCEECRRMRNRAITVVEATYRQLRTRLQARKERGQLSDA
jgi:glutamyl-tRNA reductase